MKIIIIGPAYPLRGGIADTNESFCRALLALGHDAHLVSFSLQYPNFLFPGKTQFSTESPPENLQIDTFVNSISPINWWTSARKINAMRPDMVIFRYWIPFMGPCLGTIARLLHKNITKFALCDNVIPHEHRIGDRAFTRYFVGTFDGFITMSKTVNQELAQFTAQPRICIPHPINDNLGQKISKTDARKHLQLDVDGQYLLFFGLVRKYKGLDLMLHAMGEEILKNKDIKLLVVGEFYDDIQIYQGIIDQHGIQNHVLIRDAFIPADDIKYYFSAADMVTQTYHTASQSGITQIAMHFDCPMLVTDVGGLSEVVQHEESGYVCPKDSNIIAESISDFFAKNRYPHFSKRVAQEKLKYSWTAFCKQILALR